MAEKVVCTICDDAAKEAKEVGVTLSVSGIKDLNRPLFIGNVCHDCFNKIDGVLTRHVDAIKIEIGFVR